MKKATIVFLVTLISGRVCSNVNFIDISKISNEDKYVIAFQFVKDNLEYYDHWTTEWSYNTPKQDLISRLRLSYSMFSSIGNKNEELNLLLGDIAHYLYNLDDSSYFDIAVDHYHLAIKESPGDYRTYWFLGYHFALSNVPVQAIDNFIKAQQLLPSDQPAEFWEEFAYASAYSAMPSHTIFAMEKVKSISGKPGNFETQLGQTTFKRIVEVDKDKSYSKEEIWTVSNEDKIIFTSRPLGIKLLVDSTWQVSLNDYNNRQTAFIIKPAAIKNTRGLAIDYTIALLFKTADDTDKLEDYVNVFVSKYPDKRKVTLSDKYDKMIAYEIIDKSMYKNIGGGHLYTVGIERKEPPYPGLLLENPVILTGGPAGQIKYYTASDYKDRFKGRMFYAILLDSCEDIHELSLSVFKALLNNQIIIE